MSIRNREILVTGGAGFIGRKIIELLNKKGIIQYHMT
ncbi:MULTISPECIES: NAD-dependent epimerase/dehydratase family protein [Acidiplasma]|nr:MULTISPECIES: NAD-dependent epimerase/dehydratase family protein [Acidiplasma]